jgi:predicted PurR-regulated permease PerM
MTDKIKLPLIVSLTLVFLFIWLAYHMLTEFRNYLYPLTLGGLFAYLLYPMANFFEQKRVPRIFANILSILIGISTVSAVGFFLYKQMGLFLEDLPGLQNTAIHNINIIFANITQTTGIKTPELKEQVKILAGNLLNLNNFNFKNTFSTTFQTIFTFGIMPVYVFFLLFYRNKFKEFMLMLVAEGKHAVTVRIIEEINQVSIHYMTGVFKVVGILIVLNSTGFLIIGLKHALLLGLLAALMNFIPYYGTIIGYFFPLFIAIFTMNSPTYALLVFLQFIVVQFTENNILTPNIVGAHVNINPFMIILSITLGGFIWGLPGMFIAVPVAAILRVLGENIPGLAPVGYLLGSSGAEEHNVTLEKMSRLFKRFTKKS